MSTSKRFGRLSHPPILPGNRNTHGAVTGGDIADLRRKLQKHAATGGRSRTRSIVRGRLVTK